MIFLARFAHHQDRLNLGKDGRNLYVFVCDFEKPNYEVCESWDSESGANACFVTEGTISTDNSYFEELKPPTVEEYFITGWRELEDRVSQAESAYFLDNQKHEQINPSELATLYDKTKAHTKLGGVPFWIQAPENPAGNGHEGCRLRYDGAG